MEFYDRLISLRLPVKDVLSDAKNFVQLPADWHVIVADIVNSTEAVKEGRHPDINLVAAGSLIAALNVARLYKVEIPYFFGGDGGIVIVPAEITAKVLDAMNAHKYNSLQNFSLELRIGSIEVEKIYRAGYEMRIAKLSIGPGFSKPIIIGDGLKYAEQLIKSPVEQTLSETAKDAADVYTALNMEGLECRWDAIKPPTKNLEVVCFLIEATDPNNQLAVYSNSLKKMDEIYGATEKRHPLSIKNLFLINSLKKFKKEMMARYGKWKTFYLLKVFFETMIGKIYFKFNLNVNNLKGQDYLLQVIECSDTLTIDGRINTIISGTGENRAAFIEFLNKEEQKGMLVYGHHVSSESVMTCYIQHLNNQHIHFVDGADGGYTKAAIELKPKFRKSNRLNE